MKSCSSKVWEEKAPSSGDSISSENYFLESALAEVCFQLGNKLVKNDLASIACSFMEELDFKELLHLNTNSEFNITFTGWTWLSARGFRTLQGQCLCRFSKMLASHPCVRKKFIFNIQREAKQPKLNILSAK